MIAAVAAVYGLIHSEDRIGTRIKLEETIMDSNYQWQKHQSTEKVRARMREAENHRLWRESTPRGDHFLARFWRALFGRRGQQPSSQQPRGRSSDIARPLQKQPRP